MLRYPRTLGVYVLILPLLALSRTVPAQAAPPPEQLLPNTTREFCACPNVKETLASFRATQFGRLLGDPKLSDFLKDVEAQVEKGGGLELMGFTLADLEQIAGGETAWATIEVGRRPAEVLLVDVTGKQKELEAVLSVRARRWQEAGGAEKKEQHGDLQLTIQEKAARKNNRPEVRIHCLKDNLLLVSDSRSVIEGAAQRWAGSDGSSLSDLATFKAVQSQTAPRQGEKVQVRFFVDPFGMLCLDDGFGQGSKKNAIWNQLRKAGLDGLKGFGGFLTFANPDHDFFYRTAVSAPKPYKKGMAIFNLVESEDLAPPCWIHGPVTSYSTFHIDFPKAFEGLAPIYDQVLVDGEEGTFKETLADLKKDPKVRLDVCEELINQLDSRVILVTDQPAGRKTGRFLAAIPVKKSKIVADAVARFYTGDDRVKKQNFQNRCTVWEMGVPPKDGLGEGKETLDIPYHVVAVTQKYLFLSNNRDMLTEVLSREQEPESSAALTQQAVYQQIHKAAVGLGCGKAVGQQFTHGADDLCALYEAVRHGTLAEADSLPAQLILQVLQAGKLKLRGDLLPEYSQVSQHLGMGGAFIRATPEGFEMIGFYPRKAKP